MNYTTVWKHLPVTSIPLEGMTTPWDIINKVKSLGVKNYVYEIKCNNITIKYGMSCAETTQPGERLYRQIGHLASWGASRLYGMNGFEFILIDDEFKNMYSKNMNHNNITIDLWNFDNYPFRTMSMFKEINDAELELIDCYKNKHNKLPFGNLFDGQVTQVKSAPSRASFEALFDL
jgi:hypothetical protein